jgi:hypothetical protein
LDVDNIQAQPILFYDSVQTFVTGFANSLRGVSAASAVAHFNQKLDYNSLYPYFPSRIRA